MILYIMRSRAMLLTSLILSGCAGSHCVDTPLRSEKDLSGPLAVFVFARECGDNAEPVVSIAIGTRGAGTSAAKLVFAADSNHGRADRDGKLLWVETHWIEPHRLSIAYGEGARVLHMDRVQGVEILARPTTRAIPIPRASVARGGSPGRPVL
jgi:hypothetical protein